MNFTELQVAIEAGRQFECTAGGVRFTLRLPSDYDLRVAYQENRDVRGESIEVKAMHAILDQAIVAWEGLKGGHFHPAGGDEPVPFSARARALLIEVRQDLADELTVAIATQSARRREEMETARKN